MRISRTQLKQTASTLLVVLLSVLAGVLVAVALTPARAETHTTGNPWVFQETDASKPGLVIRCAGGQNGQCLEIKDFLDQPISGANRAGAALWFAGDNLVGYGENDVFNWRFKVDPENPTPPQNECYGLSGIENRIFIGVGNGPDAGIYQCKNGPYALYWSKIG